MLTEDYLVKSVIRHGPDILTNCLLTDAPEKYISRILTEHLPYPLLSQTADIIWFIPDYYSSLNIHRYCLDLCNTQEQIDRVNLEFTYYTDLGMVSVLQAMKYIVDTLRANDVIWGVGRGSSVASYVLFLIGIHKIDSIKYELDIKEFFH